MENENQASQIMQDQPVIQSEQVAQKKPRKGMRVLLVVFLMAVSFVVGWRLMAYQWWPTLGPWVKNAVYTVIPALRPQEPIPAEVVLYTPRADAQVGDPISSADSLFYYFYFPTCPYCSTYGNMLLAGLPEQITLPDGTSSRVVMIPINKHDEAESVHIYRYYEEHGIVKNEEQNDQVVPTIVIGDRYLRGTAEIRDHFYRLLLSGEGLNTPLIDGAERVN